MKAWQVVDMLDKISVTDDVFADKIENLSAQIEDLLKIKRELVDKLEEEIISEIDDSSLSEEKKNLEKSKIIWTLIRINNDHFDTSPNPYV